MIINKTSIMLNRSALSSSIRAQLSRCMSSSSSPTPDSRVVTLQDGKQRQWYAGEQDPRKHNISHAGLFYIMPGEAEMIKIFSYPNPFHIYNLQPFHQCIGFIPLMIRQPALTAMDSIRQVTSESQTTKKLLFYGDKGHGKNHSLVHLTHYLHLQQTHFIIYSRDVRLHTNSPRETAPSISRPGRVDTPIMSALALQSFRIQNADLLKQHEQTLLCSQDYRWSARETTKAGDPLISIVEHGLNRVVHASDCFAVLVKELIRAADEGKIKLSFIGNHVSTLFEEYAGTLRHPDFKSVLANELTIVRAFKKLVSGKYKNGLIVVSVHDRYNRLHQNQTPESVLTDEGLECFDDAERINVPKYSRQEFENAMNFYEDIGWLVRPVSRTATVRDEVRFISALNPLQVERLCRAI